MLRRFLSSMVITILVVMVCVFYLFPGERSWEAFARFKPPSASVFVELGTPYQTTVSITTTNSSVSLMSAINTALGTTINLDVVKSVLISVEDNDARIAWKTAASNGTPPVGHPLYKNSSHYLTSTEAISEGYIISKTAGSHARLQVTLFMN